MWASALERAGVQVVYGFIEWKTHAKMSMVVRREEGGYRTYCHLGTGNYHPVTARIYTDLSFFTADPRVGRDVAAHLQLHHRLYRAARARADHHVAAQPARRSSCDLIDARDRPMSAPASRGAIWAKMNSLVDPAIIDKLYEASQAGRRDRPRHPRHLLPAARRSRPVREYPRQVDRRPLPRAQPDLVLRQWRRAAQSRGQGLSSARPTGCRAISTAASNMRCRSRTRPSTPRSSTR